MNNGWHINSRTAAWREAFSKASLDHIMSAARAAQPNVRALAQRKIAQYYRRKRWHEAMLLAAVIAFAVVGTVMLIALIVGAR